MGSNDNPIRGEVWKAFTFVICAAIMIKTFVEAIGYRPWDDDGLYIGKDGRFKFLG